MDQTNGGLHFESDLSTDKLYKKIDEAYKKIEGFSVDVEKLTVRIDQAFGKIGFSFEKGLDASFESVLSDLQKKYNELNKSLQTAVADPSGLAEEKKELQEINPLLDEHAKKYDEMQAQIAAMQNALNQNAESRRREVEALNTQIKSYQDALTDLRNKFEEAVDGKKITEETQDAITKIDEMGNSVKTVVSEIERVNETKFDFGITKENIKIQKEAIEDLKRQIKELENKADATAPGMAKASILGQIGPLKAELAAEEKALIELQSELGQTEQKYISLTTERNKALDVMRRLRLENKQGSEEYKAAEKAVTDYTQAIDQTNAKAKMLASGGFAGMVQNLSVATGMLSTGVAITGLFSSENENLNRIMLKTQALLSATITLQQVQQSVTTKGIFGITSLATAKTAWAAANARVAASLGITTIAAQALMGVLTLGLSVAIGAVIYAWSKLSEKQAEQVKMNKAVADSLAGPMVAYKTLQAQWNALGNDLNKKKKFITDNKDEFHDLGVEVGNVSEAEKFLVSQSENFEKAMMLRAEAAAKAQIAMEKFKQAIEADREIEDFDKNWKDSNFFGKIGLSAQAIFTNLDHKKGSKLKEEAEKMIKDQVDLLEKADELAKKAANPYTGPTKKPTKPQELAEIFDEGSILKLRQQISLMDAALDRMGKNGEVRLRALDKYGKEYATKEVTTRENAMKMREQLAEQLAEAEKRIMIQAFDEQLEETRKHIEQRDKLMQMGFSKEQADALFPGVKDKTFISYLEETDSALKKLMDSGKGKPETADNLAKIREEIEKYKGHESYIDGVNESINDLKNQFSGSELIGKLKNQLAVVAGDATEKEEAERKRIYEKAIKEEEAAVKKRYQNILTEQRTFQEKSQALQREYEDAMSQAETGGEKAKVEQHFSSLFTDLFFEEMAKSPEWAQIFIDMNEVASQKLQEFRAMLVKMLQNAKSEADKIEIGGFIKQIDDALRSRNFGRAIKEFFDKITDGAATAEQKLEALMRAIAEVQGYLQSAQSIVSDLRGIFDDLGISTDNAFGDVLSDIEKTIEGLGQLSEGVSEFAVGYASGNPIQMVAGGIKAIGGVIKAVSGWFNDDDKRERNIQRYTLELQELERVFASLNRTISKTIDSSFFDVSKAAIDNLRAQQAKLRQMINEEQGKKDSDSGKIKDYENQIAAIDNSIEDMIQNMADKIMAGMDAQSIMDKLSDVLVTAFENGEDAALAMGRTVDQILREMVINALKMEILAPAMKKVVDQIMQSMGYGQTDNSTEINSAQATLAQLEQELANTSSIWDAKKYIELQAKIAALKAFIAKLQSGQGVEGAFDGLTEEERQKIKDMIANASNDFTNALQQYEDLFGDAAGAAMGMKGDIKGITEKTAGALEGQLNAMRINVAETLKIHQANKLVFENSLHNLIAIEWNTRHLIKIQKDIAEMNEKMNKKLAGIP